MERFLSRIIFINSGRVFQSLRDHLWVFILTTLTTSVVHAQCIDKPSATSYRLTNGQGHRMVGADSQCREATNNLPSGRDLFIPNNMAAEGIMVEAAEQAGAEDSKAPVVVVAPHPSLTIPLARTLSLRVVAVAAVDIKAAGLAATVARDVPVRAATARLAVAETTVAETTVAEAVVVDTLWVYQE